MIVIVAIGIIIYYITAYFSYQHFDDIFLEKLGSKVIYHDMFKWNQSNHVAVKIDAGFKFVFIALDLCFRYEEVVSDTFDAIYFILIILYIVLMKYYLRYEVSLWLWVTVSIRVCLVAWDIYVLSNLVHSDHPYFSDGAGNVVAIGTFTVIVIAIIFEVFTSYKCVTNFGKGLRDMINKQHKSSEDIDNIDKEMKEEVLNTEE